MSNIMTKLCVAVLIGVIGLPVLADKLDHLEYAAEVLKAKLGNAPTRGGLIYVKRCDECQIEGVSFDASTLYFQDDDQISAKEAQARNGQGATVFYQPTTKLVTRVVFW